MVRFSESVQGPRRRLAISTLAIAVVVFVAVGIAAELILLPKASTSSAPATTTGPITTTNGPPPSTPVKVAVDQWVSDFNTRNVAGLANFYSTGAAVTWSGNAAGLAGTYNGQGNIKILYGSSIGKTLILNASISNYVESAANPSNINVTMLVNMNGNSSVVGELTSTVAATQMWNYNGQQWQIVKENWNYKTFNVQYPVSATTFPQWGALRVGKNPSLVSEKSFEWNAGPYVAASVYAFLFGVLAIGVMKYRGRPRTD